jgi:hypothetical protein
MCRKGIMCAVNIYIAGCTDWFTDLSEVHCTVYCANMNYLVLQLLANCRIVT